MRVEPLFKKVSKPLQTSLSKSASEGDFCRDVCSGLGIFCENGQTAAEGVPYGTEISKNFKIRMRVEALFKKVSKPLQTSLQKSASEGDFGRDVCSGLGIFHGNGQTAAEGVPDGPKISKKIKIRMRVEPLFRKVSKPLQTSL